MNVFWNLQGKRDFLKTHSMQEYPNVVIVKAFTKLYAIPGVRLGFLFCGGNKASQIFNQLPGGTSQSLQADRTCGIR